MEDGEVGEGALEGLQGLFDGALDLEGGRLARALDCREGNARSEKLHEQGGAK